MIPITLYTFVYMLSEMLGTYSVYKVINIFFKSKKNSKTVIRIAFVVYYLTAVAIYLLINIPIINLAFNFVVLFLLSLLYSSSIEKIILLDLLICAFMIGTEMIVVTLTGYINFPIIERNDYNSIFGIIVMNILKYIASLMMNGFKYIKEGNKLPKVYWLSLFLIPTASLFMLFAIFQSSGLNIAKTTISILSVLIINFSVFYLFDKMSHLYQEMQEKKFIEQQNSYYENQILIINEAQEASRLLRHDMKNHLQAIYLDLKSGNGIEAQKHITELVDACGNTHYIINTGYPTIDSLVNYKLQSAKKLGVNINTSIEIPFGLEFSSFDFTVILGNLLDNAVQAVSTISDNSFIDFTMRYTKGMMIIKISNTFNSEFKTENGLVLTSKTDKKTHGFGLKSVNEVVRKYNGTTEIQTDGNIFTITVILYVD